MIAINGAEARVMDVDIEWWWGAIAAGVVVLALWHLVYVVRRAMVVVMSMVLASVIAWYLSAWVAIGVEAVAPESIAGAGFVFGIAVGLLAFWRLSLGFYALLFSRFL